VQLQFVPVRDEQLFDTGEAFRATLVPFSLDFDCHHWLQQDAERPAADKGSENVPPKP